MIQTRKLILLKTHECRFLQVTSNTKNIVSSLKKQTNLEGRTELLYYSGNYSENTVSLLTSLEVLIGAELLYYSGN